MERRLTAILAADLVGYSRLMEQDEEATFERLRSHRRELFEPTITKSRGRIFKLMGDGLLAEFASILDAVECALELQRKLAERNDQVPGDSQMQFRIGVNLGDVIIEGKDRHGDGVNIAARLQMMAAPGEICISAAVYEQVKKKLHIGFEDLGSRSAKNLSHPIHVYRAHTSKASQVAPDQPKADLAAPEKPSIAVLPFDNLGSDTEGTLFADGLVEDIITGLSRIPALLVIARNSTFTYKGRAVSVKDVARDLAVQYVMEGSVRRAGDQVRVTAQLIDARAGTHVWADRFDRNFAAPFELQDEIARAVVSTLQQQLYLSEGRGAARRSDRTDTDLWNLLQRSWARLHDLTPEALAEAREMAERAVAMAPDNARAHFLVGCTLTHEAWLMYRRDYDVAIKRALFHAERSVALDDNDEHAHWCLGGVYWAMDRLEAAIAEYERALEINPNWSIGLSDLGEALCYAGRPEEGLPNIESAMRLNPRDASMFFRYGGMAIGHYLLGNFETAEQWARRAVQRRRQYFYGHVMLTASLVRLGRVQDSQSAASDLLQIFPGFSIAELKKAGFAAAAFQRLRTDLRMAGIPEGPGALAEPDHKN